MNILLSGVMIVLVSAASAFAGALLLRLDARQRASDPTRLSAADHEAVVFLFHQRSLRDATPRARALLPPLLIEGDDWTRFLVAFAPRFDGLEARLARLRPHQPLHIAEDRTDPLSPVLQAERVGTVLRLSLLDPRQSPPLPAEQHAIQAMEAELSILRAVAETAPVLTWRQIDDGTIVWVNGAYLAALRDEFDPEIAAHWPPAALFDAAALDAVHADSAMPHRVTYFSTASQSPRWFHLQCLRQGCGTLYFATPIDDLVQSEATLQGFIGTLGKTFAQLPTGLAIFDAKRRLVLFNPALIDLTGLGAETLSQRPSLHGFLDALRENQRIPEPRDYKSWRLRIAQLEAAATDGRYQETWTLPTGQSYRVTGQPHPDGAVAFLFEDISSEVSLTRRFRSELDISSAVLNAVDHGLAVFAQDGTLSLWNTRYKEFWSTDPDHALSRITLEDCFALWGLGPGPGDAALMARLRDFVLAGPAREQFAFSLAVVEDGAGAAGITFDIAVRGLPQRATLMEFQRRQISAEKRPEAIKPTDLAG